MLSRQAGAPAPVAVEALLLLVRGQQVEAAEGFWAAGTGGEPVLGPAEFGSPFQHCAVEVEF